VRDLAGGTTVGRLLAVVAVIIFVVAAVDKWPSDLDGVEPVALGLAFLAGSLVLH
jgi:hypothetical protein